MDRRGLAGYSHKRHEDSDMTEAAALSLGEAAAGVKRTVGALWDGEDGLGGSQSFILLMW